MNIDELQKIVEELTFYAQLRKEKDYIDMQRMQYDDAERKRFAELHEPWAAGKAYGANHYLKYGVDANGRAVLYRTTRNIASSTTPPDVPTNPQQYVKV